MLGILYIHHLFKIYYFQILCSFIFSSVIYTMTAQPFELTRFTMFFATSTLVVFVAQGFGLMIGAYFDIIVSMLVNLEIHSKIQLRKSVPGALFHYNSLLFSNNKVFVFRLLHREPFQRTYIGHVANYFYKLHLCSRAFHFLIIYFVKTFKLIRSVSIYPRFVCYSLKWQLTREHMVPFVLGIKH